MNAEDRIFRKIGIQQKSAFVPVFGDMGDAQLLRLATEKFVISLPESVTCRLKRGEQTGEGFDQFGLAVAFDAGDADDFAGPHIKRNIFNAAPCLPDD